MEIGPTTSHDLTVCSCFFEEHGRSISLLGPEQEWGQGYKPYWHPNPTGSSPAGAERNMMPRWVAWVVGAGDLGFWAPA